MPTQFLVLVSLLAITCLSQAQVRVELELRRIEYLEFEPILATVRIVNMSARPIILGEVDSEWLTFRIEDAFGNIIPKASGFRGAEYIKLDPGNQGTHTVNLTPMYSIRKPGRYKVQAVVRAHERTYLSPPKPLEIRQGKLIWEDRIGVLRADKSEEFRIFSLVKFPRVGDSFLYLQIKGEDNGVIYTTTRLARVIASDMAVAEFDRDGHLHILFQTEPRAYGYYVADHSGHQVDTAIYTSYNSTPKLKIDPQRRIAVIGGERQVEPDSDVPQRPRFIPPPFVPTASD